MRDERLRQLFHELATPVAEAAEPPDPAAVRRRGRRRRRVAVGGVLAAAAIVVAGVVAVQATVGGPPAPAGTGPAPATSAPSPTTNVPPPTATGPPPRTTSGALAAGPLPHGFKPQSVTFVSTSVGYALGGAPCAKPPCTSLVRTRDGGRRWEGVPAPVAPLVPPGQAAAASAVSEVRFATERDGWVYGPGLYATHDGGASWRPAAGLDGPVLDLEAAGGWVYAATSARLWTARAGGDGWRPVAGLGASQAVRAELVLHGASWWRLQWLRGTGQLRVELAAGVAGGRGRVLGGLPCADPASVWQAAELAAADGRDLALACAGDSAAGSEGKRLYLSGDAGAGWRRTPADPPLPGRIGALAAPTPGTLVLALGGPGGGLVASRDGGRSWARVADGSAFDGFGYVGFTSALQGVAVPTAPDGRLWFTRDGGRGWSPYRFPS
ncbi:MAG TPA: hypothetical protein VFD04_26405 [Actinomycetes bacterium]|nr:hypothetical protein [Actinomycetes bacterium]